MAGDKPINTLLTTGAIHYINYDGMAVVIFNSQADNTIFEVVGVYRDKKGIIKRIKRDSEIWRTIDHFRKTENEEIPVRGEGGLQKISKSGLDEYIKNLPGNPFIAFPDSR